MNYIKLRINNPFFSPAEELLLCDGEPCVIYGKNGTGKSTISKAFKVIKGLDSDDLTACLLDSNGDEILLNEESKKRIYVFDEDFALDNVKFKKDGLGSIVIIGENNQLDEKIDELLEENKKLTETIDKMNLSKFTEKKNPYNVVESKERIINQLKKDSGYADRGKEINGSKIKIKVTDETLNEIINVPHDIPLSELQPQFNELLLLIEKTRKYEAHYECSPISLVSFTENDIRKCLNYSDDVSLRDELKNKFKVVSSKYGTRLISEVKSDAKTIKYCPLCLRDFDSGEHDDFLLMIDTVFDDKAKQIVLEIEKYEFQMHELALITNDMPICGILDQKLIFDYNQTASDYNSFLRKIGDLLKKKKDNPKAPIFDIIPPLDTAIDSITKKHKLIEEQINQFNFAFEKRKENENKAKNLNLMMAYHEVKDFIASWKKLLKEQADSLEQEKNINKSIEKNRNSIQSFRAQKKNHSIAIEEINRNLATIFSSKSRLRLSASPDDESIYEVYCRDKKAKPKLLSTGERNAIALCYFYEKLKEDKNRINAFNEEMTVIIDDPVTSLDYEAKNGILNFIKKIVREVTDGNNNSGIVILTHELEMLQQFMTQNNSFNLCTLTSKKQVMKLNVKKFSVYGFMMRELYEFAVSENPDVTGDETIYNQSRRVLEGFSSFVYRKSFKDLFEESILNTMLDSKARNYFLGTSSNSDLNSESHLQYWMKRFPDNIESLFDGESAQKMVRQCLLLLYHLNPLHVLENIAPVTGLSNDALSREEIVRTIKRWGDDLF